jgi:hypothetical protein
MDIGGWLRGLGLQRYEQVFRENFLDLVLARIDALPVLAAATFRPEFQPPWTGQP